MDSAQSPNPVFRRLVDFKSRLSARLCSSARRTPRLDDNRGAARAYGHVRRGRRPLHRFYGRIFHDERLAHHLAVDRRLPEERTYPLHEVLPAPIFAALSSPHCDVARDVMRRPHRVIGSQTAVARDWGRLCLFDGLLARLGRTRRHLHRSSLVACGRGAVLFAVAPLFALILRWLGVSWSTVAIIALGTSGFALWRIWLTSHSAVVVYLFTALDMRADSLLIGCGMAVVLKLVNLADYPRFSRWLMLSLLPISIALVIAGLTIDKDLRWNFYVSPLFGAIPSAALIVAILQPQRNFMHRLYEHPIPVLCGRICYGLYVWHWPIFYVMLANLQFHPLGVLFVGWPLAFAVSIASYYLIERHFMRARPL